MNALHHLAPGGFAEDVSMTRLPDVLPLIGLDGITLKHGGHEDRESGVCLLEAVAWVAGEPHSDQPACACPVMAAFGRAWNDAIPDDATRTRLLKPLVTLLIGSKSTPAVELQRSYLAFDWLARVQGPAWMDLTPALQPHAEAVRALAPLTDKASVTAANTTLTAARAAAGDAAWDAAWDAARDAARAAAGDALAPTVALLQASALDLLQRMADIKEAV
jgi:hypothetical protein